MNRYDIDLQKFIKNIIEVYGQVNKNENLCNNL